jgi:hypothetical protein
MKVTYLDLVGEGYMGSMQKYYPMCCVIDEINYYK